MRKLLLAGAVLALSAAAVHATVMKRLTLSEIEGYASEIFSGTVLSIETVPDDSPRNLIYTEVTFHRLTSLKGSFPQATVTYRFAGGTYGGRTLRVVGMPEFRVGERCFLFTNAEVDKLCPAIGWWQGRYLVVEDAERQHRLHDSDGKPVYGFSNGHPVRTPKDREAKPMAVSDFETLVKTTIRAGEERRKKEEERRKQEEEEKGGER